MYRVMILMSTYNGEKYIKEQIDSLLNQKGVDVEILIRDDGSKDSTLDIIKSYQNNKIAYYTGENLGAAYSFIDLVCKAPKADFYAYCDQDDVWYDDKLYTAAEKLNKINGKALYMSTYDVVDSELNLIKVQDFHFERPYTLTRTIVRGCPSGCTMVFNQMLKCEIATAPPNFIRMHDYWTLLTVEAFEGTIITDSTPRIKYRQHENNTVGIVPSKRVVIKRLLDSAIYKKNERWKQACSVLESYKDKLPMESVEILLSVQNYKNSFRNRLKFAFDKRFQPKELRYRVLFWGSVILGIF